MAFRGAGRPEVIDFGMAKRFTKGQARFVSKVGSSFYVAPEVLTGLGLRSDEGHYNEKCDIWSSGVVTYMLLSSVPPFYGPSKSKILDSVVHGRLYFPSRTWKRISKDSKGLVKKMLTRSVPCVTDFLRSIRESQTAVSLAKGPVTMLAAALRPVGVWKSPRPRTRGHVRATSSNVAAHARQHMRRQ